MIGPATDLAMRVLIVDDDASVRTKVRRLLARDPAVTVVGEAADGPAAVAMVRERAPDVVVLDLRLPDLDGFAVIRAVGVDRMPRVVFTTSPDDHATRALEVRALDYLLKPFTPDRFRSVLQRVRHELARRDGDGGRAVRLQELLDAVGSRPRYLDRLLVHHRHRPLFIPVERIDRIEADRNYVRLHGGGASYVMRGSIGALAERLDPGRFLRISRSDIVRLDAVTELHPWFHGDYRVILADGTALMWSRRYRAQAEGALGPG